MVPSRLHELHESIFPFVSRIEFIRSKLSNFSAHVSGVNNDGCGRTGTVQCGEMTGLDRMCRPAGHGRIACVRRGRKAVRSARRRPSEVFRAESIPRPPKHSITAQFAGNCGRVISEWVIFQGGESSLEVGRAPAHGPTD